MDGLAAWFPTTQLPVRADVYLRFAWQFQTRAGVRVSADPRVALARRLAATTPSSRSAATSVSSPRWTVFCSRTCRVRGPATSAPAQRWDARQRRARSTRRSSPKARRALTCFRAVENELPGLQLVVMTNEIDPRGPAVAADLTLVRTTQSSRREAASRRAWRRRAGCVAIGPTRRSVDGGRTAASPTATSSAITREFQRSAGRSSAGRTTTRWPTSPKASAIAPAVSSSIFPVRF